MVAPIPGSRRILARLRFALLTAASVTMGFIPIVAFRAHRVWFYLIVIASVSLLISLLIAIGLDPRNERPVTLKEAVAIAIGALSESSIIGLMLFPFYGTGWLLTVILDKIGWHPHWIDTVGTVLFNGFGLLFLVGVIGITTERLTKWLFPTTGIGNAPLLPYANTRQFSWAKLVVFLFVIVVIGFCFFYIRFLFYLLLQFVIVGVATPLSQRLEKSGPSERTETLLTAVKNLLQACGYTIVDRLQTHDIELDRLLSVFGMMAHRNGYALAIQLKVGEKGDAPVSWTEATYLGTASRAAYQAIGFIDGTVHSVLPMLIISGTTADSALLTFAARESIRIGQIPDWTEVEALASKELSDEDVRQKAQSYLGIRSSSEARVQETAGERAQ